MSKMYSIFNFRMLSLLLVDSAIIVIILSAGVYSLKTNSTLKEQIDED
jgi:hypothetical protein